MGKIKVLINDDRYITMAYDENDQENTKLKLRRLVDAFEEEARKQMSLPTKFDEFMEKNARKEGVKDANRLERDRG